jgi:nucleotide-binding universal stress UspA family protein
MLVLRIAEELAKVEQATLHLCYISDQPSKVNATERPPNRRTWMPSGYIVHSLAGHPAESIIRLAHELPDALIVMSTHSYIEKIGGVLGPLATQVIRHIFNPVVLVPLSVSERPWRIHNIVLAHDGAPSTDVAVHPATALAYLTGAELVILHVADRLGRASEELGTITAPFYLDQPQHEWPAWGD